jgi:predicted dehydrogenase
VYSEKPLAMRFAEVEALVALAAAKGLTLAGAPCNHLGEAAQAVRRALAQGRIGRPLLAYAELDNNLIAKCPVEHWKNLSGAPWPREDEFRVGCTLEHAGYYLTWLVFFFGPVAEVTAFAALQYPGKPTGGAPEAPDFSVAALKFASGMVARLTCSVVAPRDHALRLFGDESELRAEDCCVYQTKVRYRRWMRVRRRLILSPWSNSVPLDPAPVAIKRGGWVGMDFIRGPIEAVRAARENRPSRVATDFCVHVNEVALAIHHAAASPGTYKVTSTCARPAPLPSPLDGRNSQDLLDRAVRPLIARVFNR